MGENENQRARCKDAPSRQPEISSRENIRPGVWSYYKHAPCKSVESSLSLHKRTTARHYFAGWWHSTACVLRLHLVSHQAPEAQQVARNGRRWTVPRNWWELGCGVTLRTMKDMVSTGLYMRSFTLRQLPRQFARLRAAYFNVAISEAFSPTKEQAASSAWRYLASSHTTIQFRILGNKIMK